ncbi:hypothetical protein SK128_025672 [Halocaridina rubra]|uniref:Uncharacterized protein n=1 Tax=Halocaridina rubra TaxID=373956 RepID=A0AAN8X6Y3_HALRR
MGLEQIGMIKSFTNKISTILSLNLKKICDSNDAFSNDRPLKNKSLNMTIFNYLWNVHIGNAKYRQKGTYTIKSKAVLPITIQRAIYKEHRPQYLYLQMLKHYIKYITKLCWRGQWLAHLIPK